MNVPGRINNNDMRQLIFFLVWFLAITINSSGQKPIIDASIFNKWPGIIKVGISNDGRYVYYVINNEPQASNTLVIFVPTERVEKRIIGISPFTCVFTPDSKKLIFQDTKDSLGIVSLSTLSVEYVPAVYSFRVPGSGAGHWLAYKAKGSSNQLQLKDLRTGVVQVFENNTDYYFSENGAVLLMKNQTIKKSDNIQTLQWLDLNSGNMIKLWQSVGGDTILNIYNYVFDRTGSKLAFTVERGSAKKEIWFFTPNDKVARRLAISQQLIEKKVLLQNVDQFSKDGHRLWVTLADNVKKNNATGTMLDVWNYRDEKLQSQQLAEKDNRDDVYTAIIALEKDTVRPLTKKHEHVVARADEYLLVERFNGECDFNEVYWNKSCAKSVYVVSSEDGSRELLGKNSECNYYLSPTGKFVVYFDPAAKNYYSYETRTHIIRNLTRSTSIQWSNEGNEYFPISSKPAAWAENDSMLFLYDQHDIWQIDPLTNRLPVNITNGYGSRNNIAFQLGLEDYSKRPILFREKLLLSAFNRSNKENGFFEISLTGRGTADPVKLTMGPFNYSVLDSPTFPFIYLYPQKAKFADAYVVKRETSTASPNYFYTVDFRNFIPVSDIHPEKRFNWLTSELINWKTFDGHVSQGILYKPENFDRKKKYPVIFTYYERLSDRLYYYHPPNPSEGEINIPWFVSRGYIVFTPDMHFHKGRTGESIVNSIVSAAKFIARYPWVDSLKMGLNGHSFGAYETNYLVTQSNLFAAAVSAAGFCDLISAYNSVTMGSGNSYFAYWAEKSQGRLGTDPWNDKQLYIRNSPIFYAHRVTTPLLIVNNKNDGIVNFAQGVEFFTALRRLGKRAWMLQYDSQEHSLFGKPAEDYTFRITQFFDHYLKGAPAPTWMTRGIPAKMKGIDDGFSLDNEIKTPGDGLLIDTSVRNK